MADTFLFDMTVERDVAKNITINSFNPEPGPLQDHIVFINFETPDARPLDTNVNRIFATARITSVDNTDPIFHTIITHGPEFPNPSLRGTIDVATSDDFPNTATTHDLITVYTDIGVTKADLTDGNLGFATGEVAGQSDPVLFYASDIPMEVDRVFY